MFFFVSRNVLIFLVVNVIFCSPMVLSYQRNIRKLLLVLSIVWMSGGETAMGQLWNPLPSPVLQNAGYNSPYWNISNGLRIFVPQPNNGTPPYTFKHVNGTLPPGLKLDSNGWINGTPTMASPKPYQFDIEVTDRFGLTDKAPFEITVDQAQLRITAAQAYDKTYDGLCDTKIDPNVTQFDEFIFDPVSVGWKWQPAKLADQVDYNYQACFTSVNAGKNIPVHITVKLLNNPSVFASDNYVLASATIMSTAPADIFQAQGTFPILPVINATYQPSMTLANILLPSGYAWDFPATQITVGVGQKFPATYTDPSGNYLPAPGNITVDVAPTLCVFPNLPIMNTMYQPMMTLANVLLPPGYVWDFPATQLSSGTGQIFSATYTDPNGNCFPVSGNITVNVAKVQIVKPSLVVTNFTYDGMSKTVSLNSSGVYTLSGHTTDTNAGNYTAIVTLNDVINYEWSDGTTVPLNLSWTISQVTIAFVAGANDKTYDGNLVATIIPNSMVFTGLVADEVLVLNTDYTVDAFFDNPNAGNHISVTITVALQNTTKANNYHLTNHQLNVTANIFKAQQATLIINHPGGKTYGDPPAALSVAGGDGTGAVSYTVVSGPGTINGATLTFDDMAGNIVVKATKAGDNNYEETTSEPLTIAVEKVLLTVTAHDKIRYEGMDNPELTFSYFNNFKFDQDSTILEDVPAIHVDADHQTPPGQVVIYFQGGDNDPRYRFHFITGRLTIVSSTKEVTYGEPPFEIPITSGVKINMSNIMVSTPGILNLNMDENDVLTATILKSGQTTVTFAITPYITIPITVKKAELIAKADNYIREQGKLNPIFTVTISGFVYGENKSVLESSPVAQCDAQPYFPPQKCEIRVVGGSADNYEFDRKSGVLEIIPGESLPTAFTPDGDGINDIWPWMDSKFKVQIFNRLGTLLYEGDNGWDGKYRGRYVQPDVYFYIATSPDGTVQRGSVEVIKMSK